MTERKLAVKWSGEPPTEAGLYWYTLKFNGSVNTLRVARVEIVDVDFPNWGLKKGDVVCVAGEGKFHKVEGMHRRWAGGLPEPEPMPSHCLACFKEHAEGILCEEARAR